MFLFIKMGKSFIRLNLVKISLYGLLFLLILSLFTLPTNAQSRRTAVEHKIGALLQVMPQQLVMVSNPLAGARKNTYFLAFGAELLYEKVIDDTFSFGAALHYFYIPTIKFAAKDYEIIGAFPFTYQNLPDENYAVDLIEFGAGLFVKAYVSPNSRPGYKTFVQVSISPMYVSANIKESTNNAQYNKNSYFLWQNASIGIDYNFRNGLGIQGAIRWSSGFTNMELVKDSKYLTISANNTVVVEFGALYSF